VQPEISRRCLTCGASYREDALFCPQCGRPLAKTPEVAFDLKASDDAHTSPPASVPNEPANAVITSPPQVIVAPAAEIKIASEAPPPKQAPKVSAQKPPKQTPPHSKPAQHETARDKLHRASTATREALAGNVKRVEKIRQVSTVMFEEAAYDPSLRFVLVALGLFIVFILLLVLSKVMG
jgi:hypothetical protein